ncbi:kinase-like domain-containing protein [Paraphoma chrysanthemicola]|uniref:non-specific serine/threonine protein kinase n=1 Tax=Paraphoma chrysanthemicola TaxID=798071 RepID=A0A8K0QX18_9PLEO|nr:kinase-like domain-containing protein [Paraphoma chrysanthemicola]
MVQAKSIVSKKRGEPSPRSATDDESEVNKKRQARSVCDSFISAQNHDLFEPPHYYSNESPEFTTFSSGNDESLALSPSYPNSHDGGSEGATPDTEPPMLGVSDDDIPTPDVFHTATPGYSAPQHTPGRLDSGSKYGQALIKEHALVAKETEANWSGRGQHVEFQRTDIVPLEVEKAIGHSGTALVESVLCRRIRLARKSIRVNRRAKLDDLVKEVAYLNRLRHRHIVQLVGSYLQGPVFAILLLYPVATGDLTKYLNEWRPSGLWYDGRTPSSPFARAEYHLSQFIVCLSHAIGYLHDQGIRHMDIKPSNILVHERRQLGEMPTRAVYLTDFGISRSFTENESSQTDGPTSMTRRWCSPEVAAGEPHGRASDIFSLGCVFTQMLTPLARMSLVEFDDFRAGETEDDSFQANLPRVEQWVAQIACKIRASSERNRHVVPPIDFVEHLQSMLREDPHMRPTASMLLENINSCMGKLEWDHAWYGRISSCCSAEREGYLVAEEDAVFNAYKFSGDLGTIS